MRIDELAYLKWEQAGRPEGDGVYFWLEAEREIKDRDAKNAKSNGKKAPAKSTQEKVQPRIAAKTSSTPVKKKK